ncbi:hypothetical protein QQ045_026238 [Rhodiola kirilowii]
MDKRVNETRAALMEAQSKVENNPMDSGLCADERRLVMEFRKIKYNQFLFNKQRTNAQWIKEGDANTKVFHGLLKSRRSRNSINQITLQDGSVSTDSAIIKHEFSMYFKELLGQAKECTPVDSGAVEQGPVVNGEKCRALVRGVTDKEICFFKRNWNIPGKELCDSVRHCLRNNDMPKGVNAAYIALIPKSSQASKPEDYRHISCCNVTYKIVASLLAGRIKEVLPSIINPAQGAVVKDRLIVDNICLAQQLFNGYGKRNISERMAWKIDLWKAYDSIDRKFLISMLQTLKFPSKFIAWMEMCIQTTSYSIMINGEMIEFFEGRRGIRQGDPLSPFLFTIAMECLSRMLQKLTKAEGFYYHPKCHCIKLLHIMLADDLIMFSSGRKSTISAIKDVTSKFLNCSGLAINFQKSHLFTEGMNDDKVGSMCRKDCDILIEKITTRLECWSNRFLSRAGRRVLVASVLQAMVFFWARVCVLPKTVIQTVNASYLRQIPVESWRGNDDEFGVKDTYNMLTEPTEAVEWHKLVWNAFNAPRDSFNVWLVVQNKLMTRDRLVQWGVPVSKSCVLCETEEESRNHLFFECRFTQEVWYKMGILDPLVQGAASNEAKNKDGSSCDYKGDKWCMDI